MALTTKTDIANFALSRLGIKRISDIATDGTKESKSCLLYIDDAIEMVCRETDWYSLFVFDYIDRSATPADDDYDYRYDLPSDFQKIVQLYPQTSEQSPVPYRLRANTIVTNLYDVDITLPIVSTDIDPAPDLITSVAHGLEDDDIVVFYRGEGATGPDPLVNNTRYYVINATTDTFKISATLGGSTVSLENNIVGTVYLSHTRVQLQYIKYSEDPTDMTPEMRLCVAYKLAYLIAFELAGSIQLQEQMQNQYTRELLRARQVDPENSQQDADEPPIWGEE